jgi:hypothetical protein
MHRLRRRPPACRREPLGSRSAKALLAIAATSLAAATLAAPAHAASPAAPGRQDGHNILRGDSTWIVPPILASN